MDSAKENIIRGIDIPKYMLDDGSNLSQFFIPLLYKFGNKTAMVWMCDKLLPIKLTINEIN